jgi:hypothetical protein
VTDDILNNPIFEKDFLTTEDALELLGTKHGRRCLGLWIHREKCARAVAMLCIELGKELPEKDEQERLTALLFHMTSPATPVWEIMREIGLVQKVCEEFAMGAPVGAFVRIDDVKGNA